jgi:UDP-2-acetamido-2-deoxy-ribo-hexuluronate aminotransferase
MQFCDLTRQYKTYKAEIDEAIQSVIDTSGFINGKEINLLENELAEYTGVAHVICCSSGTDALLLALMALDLQPGDEVICPAFSFFASASMVSLLKGKPVFVDVSPIDYNIDVAKIEEKITSKTKGIIAVSLFGQCADFDAINEIANTHGLWVVEDAAQSFGATYKGRKSCSLTEVAITSFFPAKPLGCYGDGGAVFTTDDIIAEKIKLLRSHGQVERYQHQLIGINGRMDTIQAAILRVKLKHFEKELYTRRLAAEMYAKLLKGHVFLPEVRDYNTSTWAQYTIGLQNRNVVREELQKKGIPTSVHYPAPLPRQQAFSDLPSYDESFEVSELLSETVLSLPMHGLITKGEVEKVANAIINITANQIN